MMSRGAVWGPDLERFGSEEWKLRGPKQVPTSCESGASGHLPCGCNLVMGYPIIMGCLWSAFGDVTLAHRGDSSKTLPDLGL